jgi:transposase
MRRDIDGLSAIVQAHLGGAPCDGTAYVFTNKARNRMKLICWDGNSVWLRQRRLHKGSFVCANSYDSVFQMTAEQWEWLTKGVDWQRLDTKPPTHWRVA